MARLLVTLVTLAVALLAGCQQAPAPKVAPTAPLAEVARLRGEAEALLARGEYAAAADKYLDALAVEPESVGLRFALGSVFSHLDRRADVIAQFRWVVSRAGTQSAEYQAARRWLVRVGALVETHGPSGESAPASNVEVRSETGQVRGRTEWPGVNPRERFIRGRIALVGDEPVTLGVKLERPFRLGDRWEFRDLQPGRYRVVARVGERTLWSQPVTVDAGKVTDLALTPANAAVSPDRVPASQLEE